MTEIQLRQMLVDKAKSYIGTAEGSTKHKEILGIYNNHKPLARGYAMKTTDAWCAAFASAMAIAAELTDIIPTECGCGEYIKLWQKLGRWQEDDAYTPKPGDYIFYDWEDSGKGDNTGGADHVGIVEKVEGGTITVIEGNKSDAVGRRAISVNGRYIRGFGIPDYASRADKTVTLTLNVLKRGSTGDQVKALQRILRDRGWHDAEGKRLKADGEFGTKTEAALKKLQKAKKLTVDGICGGKTWSELLGV